MPGGESAVRIIEYDFNWSGCWMRAQWYEIERSSTPVTYHKRRMYWLWRRLHGGGTVSRLSTLMYMHRIAQTEWLVKGLFLILISIELIKKAHQRRNYSFQTHSARLRHYVLVKTARSVFGRGLEGAMNVRSINSKGTHTRLEALNR